MLRIEGNAGRFCDGVSRRSFLQIGGLALGGAALPQILQAQQQSGKGSQHKAVIMIFLAGGPPHQDMLDLKPDAPVEVRGEFDPIATSVPGIQISELMPRIAGMMDKFAIIRSLVGAQGGHNSIQCTTGHPAGGNAPQGGWPAIGSSLSKLAGPVDPSVPPYLDLSHQMAHDPWNQKGPGFLGTAHAPVRADGESIQNMRLSEADSDRLHSRANLLGRLDRFRRAADAQLDAGQLDTFTAQALGVLSSSRLVDALDLEREDPAVRARYGQDDPDVLGYSHDKGYQAMPSRFLQARRLVEAGVRCVTLSFAHFDWHGNNFGSARKVVPLLDQGVAALVEDLHERGLDRDVTVLVWGEFGRTPKINERAGRDHWPSVHAALMAGGGMQTGQVIGSTNRLAEVAEDRPVHMQEVFATLYHNLGIDVATTTIPDHNGRPQYLVDHREPIRELV
ncbi:DUF1501 domain-containing protein [Lignipirellula cremea]|uniref:DUF1501 domain-containing protein n=1 Tax=Lignipirellula cremea TaxID=2528010 RepID=A0A518DLY3_9BACT|nr:DUF1501 domain-containing protein [Lignipirellula cremea]QDU92849.1 hypothetical protein Pla8534_06220 [Lignipirellula cremea]